MIYYVEFFVVPLVAFLLAIFAAIYVQLMWLLPLFVLGFMTWGLLEYSIHRFPLHAWPLFSKGHSFHHQFPKSYIDLTTIIVIVAFSLGGYGLSLITGPAVSAAIFAGMLASYGQYIFIHHMLHHNDHKLFGRRMTKLWDHHAAHHRGGDWNFGVSTILWDKMFGTMRP